MKKAISLGVAAAMAATLLAGCGTAASSAATSSEAASTADSTTAESTATSEAAPSEAHEINTTDPIELTISWWGGDSRHEAYQKALEAFSNQLLCQIFLLFHSFSPLSNPDFSQTINLSNDTIFSGKMQRACVIFLIILQNFPAYFFL